MRRVKLDSPSNDAVLILFQDEFMALLDQPSDRGIVEMSRSEPADADASAEGIDSLCIRGLAVRHEDELELHPRLVESMAVLLAPQQILRATRERRGDTRTVTVCQRSGRHVSVRAFGADAIMIGLHERGIMDALIHEAFQDLLGDQTGGISIEWFESEDGRTGATKVVRSGGSWILEESGRAMGDDSALQELLSVLPERGSGS